MQLEQKPIIPSNLGMNIAAGQDGVILGVESGATFRNLRLNLKMDPTNGAILTTLGGQETFSEMLQRRNDRNVNERIWTPGTASGFQSLAGNGLEISNAGISLAITTTIDNKKYAILARRESNDGSNHLMLISGYVDAAKIRSAVPGQPLSTAATVFGNIGAEGAEEINHLAMPGYFAATRLRGEYIRQIANELCLVSGDQIASGSGMIFYRNTYEELTYRPDLWCTLVTCPLPKFIHNVFTPPSVTIDNISFPGVGFQVHTHTNSGQMIVGMEYRFDLNDDRDTISLQHAEDRPVLGNDIRAQTLRQAIKDPLETRLDQGGLILCLLDEHGQLTPNFSLFKEGTLKRAQHLGSLEGITFSDAFVPSVTVGGSGPSTPQGLTGFVDRGAIPALDYFRYLKGYHFSGSASATRSFGGWSPERLVLPTPEPATDRSLDTRVAALRSALQPYAASAPSPESFYSLPKLATSRERGDTEVGILTAINDHLRSRSAKTPKPLDLLSDDTEHVKIYAGVDYHSRGPVIVNSAHLERIFPGFTAPSLEELAARRAVGQEYYGTMPGTESAYAGAVVKALQPRTVFIIGEHRGALTHYLAQCAPSDCIFITMDLPQSMQSAGETRVIDSINKSYLTYQESELGSVWREANDMLKERIFGFLGDSTHAHTSTLTDLLAGKFDIVIVDGNHEEDAVIEDLLTASKLLSPSGLVIIDDFNKLPRLKDVEYGVHITRSWLAEFPHLYQVSWGHGELAVDSNLAFLLKGEDPSMEQRRERLQTRFNQRKSRRT